METETVLNSAEWVNAGGLFLILIGISFLIAEFFIPSFGMFGFSGVSAIIIGIIQLHQTGYLTELPISINGMIALATFGISLSILGGYYSYKLYRKKVTTGAEAMIGEEVTVKVWNKNKGKVHIQGEDWKAYSDEELDIEEGDTAIISYIDGLSIKIIKPY